MDPFRWLVYQRIIFSAEKISQLPSKLCFSANCEFFWIIFQPLALSFDTTAIPKRVYLFHNPPYNFSKRTHEDGYWSFCVFFLCVSVCWIVNQHFISPSPVSAKVLFCFAWPIKSLAQTLAPARCLDYFPLKQNETTNIKSDGEYYLPFPIFNHVVNFIQWEPEEIVRWVVGLDILNRTSLQTMTIMIPISSSVCKSICDNSPTPNILRLAYKLDQPPDRIVKKCTGSKKSAT